MNSAIRIENIRKVIKNGSEVKVFKAFRLQGDAYVFAGEFYAPKRTANKNLHKFVP
jgi:hypothetical protein